MTSSRRVLAAVAPMLIVLGAYSDQADDHKRFLQILSERRADIRPAQYGEFLGRVFSAEHPPRESTGLVPLTDLGAGTYQGEQGGLYPGGSNVVPPSHLNAGLKIAREITPLDAQGKYSKDGKIGFLYIALNEFPDFRKVALADKQLTPLLAMVDTFQVGRGADYIADAKSNWWNIVAQRLSEAGVTAQQVEAAWLKPVLPWPWRGFPWEARAMQGNFADILRIAKARFPNLKIAYISTRIYAGNSLNPTSPEPYCYESAFSVKWLIADQIAGNPDLNYDPARGPIRCPWLAWGPYLWSDGTKGRRDGLVWLRSDFGTDGMHPVQAGREKIARQLLEFLKKDETSRPWFNK